MNTQSQIFIDNRVVKPVIAALNVLVRIVGFVLRLNHNLDRDFKTIAVCKYKGMGSIVQATPLIVALRKRYPKARLVFVSTKANQGILSMVSELDELVLLDDRNLRSILLTYPGFLFRLIKLRIGVFIDLEIYSNFSSLNTTLSLARNRVGFYLRSSQYRMGIYTHMMFFNTQTPIKQAYLQMARLLGISNPSDEIPALIEAPEQPKYSNYLVVNPNASDLRIERRWPSHHFVELIQQLLGAYPKYKIILIGGKSEKGYVDSLFNLIESPQQQVINLAGVTYLKELTELLSYASLFITNDTGPMHIAAAQKRQHWLCLVLVRLCSMARCQPYIPFIKTCIVVLASMNLLYRLAKEIINA